tara:strand:- start:6182 stop:6400 length:219 start_codon:yes stop_codon:yes gene_type:complete
MYINKEKRRVVVGLSKTWQIIYLVDIKVESILDNLIKLISTFASDLKKEKNSQTYIQIIKPKRISNIKLLSE